MKKAYLLRFEESEQGTFGAFAMPEIGFSCYIGELPDRNNERGYSRINVGEYSVIPYFSSTFGNCWKLLDVEGRDNILIHYGNFVGDKHKLYGTDSDGCLIVGLQIGQLNNRNVLVRNGINTPSRVQKVVLNSKKALQKLNKVTKRKSFLLTIK